MKKVLTLLLLSSLLLIFSSGCSKNTNGSKAAQQPGTAPATQSTSAAETPKQTVSLKEVAQKEKELLDRLQPLHQKVSDAYGSFNKGTINREKLNSELSLIKPEVDKIKQESTDYYKTNALSPADKDSPAYKDGLKYGKKLRSEISSMLTSAISGINVLEPKIVDGKATMESSSIKKKILNDTELKTRFTAKEKKYQEYYTKLTNSLKKI